MATGVIRTAAATTREVVPVVSANKAQSRSNVLAVYKEMLVCFVIFFSKTDYSICQNCHIVTFVQSILFT